MIIEARYNLALAAVLLAGCAGTPTNSAPTAAGDCKVLTASLATTDEEQRAALDKQQGAWKAVIPVAVVVRYAKGKADAAEAEQRHADLQRELDARGCAKG